MKDAQGRDEVSKIIDDNMGLVSNILQKFKPKARHVQEMMQIGRIALWESYQTYNPKISKFGTYAYRKIYWGFLRYYKSLQKDSRYTQHEPDIIYDPNIEESDEIDFLPVSLTDEERIIIKLYIDGNKLNKISKEIELPYKKVLGLYKTAKQKILENDNEKKKDINL